MKTPDYLSYDRYKKKKDSNPNKKILIFITTFFATLFLFTMVAKSLSPNVDVTIGDESQTDAKETGLGVKKFIDERLKMIQLDDNSAGVSVKSDKPSSDDDNAGFYKYPKEQDEKIDLPVKQDKYSNQENLDDVQDEEPVQQPSAAAMRTAPRPTGKDLAKPMAKSVSKPVENQKMSKVYVGRYANIEQAKVAQEILMDSGLGITPFIKDAGSYYTLQIGSYSSRAKAEGLASELQRNSFPARVIQE
jgi:cell division protein FtsN